MRSIRLLTLALVCAAYSVGSEPLFADSMAVLQLRCPEGQAAYDYEAWEFIENNARRTADSYAVENNPQATYILAEVAVFFQLEGEYAGEYHVRLLNVAPSGTAFAMLRPTFDFCSDPSSLDDEREDLFEVVLAKLDGREF